MKSWTDATTLADGTPFESWEKPATYRKTYYVDQKNPVAHDENPGSQDAPFLTINRAAEVLRAGEKVIIRGGLYRESIHPMAGGSGPDAMICYEAADGESVVVSGAVEARRPWQLSHDWNFSAARKMKEEVHFPVYELDIADFDYRGYNPFGMVNVLQDRFWLWHKRIEMDPFFRRRGMILVDGVPMQQCEHPSFVGRAANTFFIHHNGTKIYARMPDDTAPDQHHIEFVIKEQVFAPAILGLGYIHIKGIRFQHAANGFPVPQRGLVSASRGHHFIIEDCIIEGANSVGLDMGNECWNAMPPKGELGYHIVRRNIIRNCGICGFAAIGAPGFLVEDNLFEDIGYQNCEHMYESAGVKVHHCVDMLFRRNVMRRIRHASGFWLDCGNKNNRISGNLFYDIHSRAAAVHFEGTHFANRIDHNIIGILRTQNDPDGLPGWGGTAIQAEGSDYMTVDHNLVFDCENDGFYSNPVQMRIIDGRGGIARKHLVRDNIFCDCRRTSVTFHTEHNQLEHNLYANAPRGFIHIGTAPGGAMAADSIPQMRLDLDGARDFIGWELEGREADLDLTFDPETQTLSISRLPETNCGPFGDLEGQITQQIDPRHLV